MISFKPLTLSDISIIQNYVNQFKPYSDFNFISMYSWSLHSQVKYCLQSDALYISLPDYLSQKPVFSFLCKNNYEEHLEKFVEWLKYNSLPIRFDLVPRDVAIEVQKILIRRGSVYKMVENRDNFDYILDVNRIAQARGENTKILDTKSLNSVKLGETK